MKAAYKLALDQLKAEAKNGLLLAKDVVAAARPAKSPLHSWFTWNQKSGFEKNLLREARELISVYYVTVEPTGGPPVRTRHFISLTTDRSTGGGYRALSEVLSDEEMTAQLLRDALAELEIFTSKYRRLQQLAGVIREIDSLLDSEQLRRPSKPKPKRRGRPPAEATA